MNRRRIPEALLWLALSGLSWGAAALSSDPDQPIHIEADSADIDEKRGVTVYEGKVEVNQGSIRILADKVTVYTGDEGLEKAIVLGKPARFRQRPDGSDIFINGRALRIEYLASENTVHLIEKAYVEQGKDTFAGYRISYDTKLNRVRARKAESGQGRVKITFTPKKKKSKPKDAQ